MAIVKARIIGTLLFLVCFSLIAQISYFNQGFLRQPDAASDRAYLGITGGASQTNIYATNLLGLVAGTNILFTTNASGHLYINTTTGSGAGGSTNLTMGLQAWYRMDEGVGTDMKDRKGYGVDVSGFYMGSLLPYFISPNPYNGGLAIQLRPEDSYGVTPSWGPAFNLSDPLDPNFSICVWINHTNASWTTWEGIVCCIDNNSYLLRYNNNGGVNRMELFLNNLSTAPFVLAGPGATGANAWAYNKWYMLTVSRSGNNYTMWQNTTIVGTHTDFGVTTTPGPALQAAYIGKDGGAANRVWQGFIGETRFYKGYALTDGDVKYLYNTYYGKQPASSLYVEKSGDTMTGDLTVETAVKVGTGATPMQMTYDAGLDKTTFSQGGNSAMEIANPAGAANVFLGGAATSDNGGVAIGSVAQATGGGVALGYLAIGNAQGVGVGNSSQGQNNGVAIGNSSVGTGFAVGIGDTAAANDHAVAVGNLTLSKPYSISIGTKSDSSGGDASIAIGPFATAFEKWSVAIGTTNTTDFPGYAATSGGGVGAFELGTGTATTPWALHYRGHPIVDSNGVFMAGGTIGLSVTQTLLLISGGATNLYTNAFVNGLLIASGPVVSAHGPSWIWPVGGYIQWPGPANILLP